jgi:hypothetical protein
MKLATSYLKAGRIEEKKPYMSFKQGEGERVDQKTGRHFTYMTETKLSELIGSVSYWRRYRSGLTKTAGESSNPLG